MKATPCRLGRRRNLSASLEATMLYSHSFLCSAMAFSVQLPEWMMSTGWPFR